jgi:hypothetical protein
MIGNPFEMVVAIILIVTVGRILKARYNAQNGIVENRDMMGNVTQHVLDNNERQASADEIRALKERIQVLERIATDNSTANDVGRQIEALRDKPL